MSLRSAEGTFPPDIGKILKMPLGRIRRRLKQSSFCFNRSRNTCAMTRNSSLRSGFGNIFILPFILRNLNKTPLPSFGHPLPRRGDKVTSLAPCGRADLRTDGVKRVRIANRLSGMHVCAKSETLGAWSKFKTGKNWLMSECEFNNSGEGCYARSPVGNLGDNFVNSDEGLISWIASHSFAMTHALLYVKNQV